MHYFSFVLLSTLMQLVAFRVAAKYLDIRIALPFLLLFALWQFAYLAVSLRRFYFAESSRAVSWPTTTVLALLLYMLNTFFITAVQFVAAAAAIWRL